MAAVLLTNVTAASARGPSRARLPEACYPALLRAGPTTPVNKFRGFWRPIYKTILVLFLVLSQEITEGVDILPETLRQLAPYGADFSNDRVIRCVGHAHGSSNSSGVQTIGGS